MCLIVSLFVVLLFCKVLVLLFQVVIDDIVCFWVIYDVVCVEFDVECWVVLVQQCYIDLGSFGLYVLMQVCYYIVCEYVEVMQLWLCFWMLVWLLIVNVQQVSVMLEWDLIVFCVFYLVLCLVIIIYVIGVLCIGGIMLGNKVLIGVEMVLGDE